MTTEERKLEPGDDGGAEEYAARALGEINRHGGGHVGCLSCLMPVVQAIYDAVAEEREACAGVLEAEWAHHLAKYPHHNVGRCEHRKLLRRIEDAIRARGK